MWDKFQRLKSEYITTSFILIFSFIIGITDILLLTMWKSADWNYQYPEWTLMYDSLAGLIFFITMIMIIININYVFSISEKKFILIIIGVGAIISISTYFISPIESFRRTLAPLEGSENYEYYPATVAAKDGIITFLSEYHSLPTTEASGNRRDAARLLESWLSSSSYIPGNEWLAAEAQDVVTQRHGPLPTLLVAVFLFIFGVSPEIATIGTHTFAVFVPFIGYFLFKQYFSIRLSRVGTLLIMFSPAYLRWQHTETVGNDIITTFFVGIALTTILYSMKKSNYRYWVLAGVAFSLAALSKFTVATLGIPIILLTLISSNGIRDSISSFGSFIAGFFILPVILFNFGFNIIIMYMFSIANVFGHGQQGGTDYFQYLLSYYNVRLIGPVLIILAAFSIVYTIYNIKQKTFVKKDLVILSFLPAFVPFMFITGVTLSRHLIIHIYIFGFMSLYVIESIHTSISNRVIQIYLISTLIVTIFAFF
jgi:hypothetical protein